MLDQPTAPATRITRIVLLERSNEAPATMPDAGFLKQHLHFGTADYFAEDWLGIRPQFTGRADPLAAGDTLWDGLSATVPVRVLSWTEPAELAQVAAAVITSGALR